jgi:hypothetical protein
MTKKRILVFMLVIALAAMLVVPSARAEDTIECCYPSNMTIVSNSDVQVIKGNTGLPTPYAAVAAFEPGIADPNPPDPNGSAWDIQLSHVFTGGADWIWESNRAVHSLEGDIAYFQRTFSIGDYPTAGTLFITCDNGYEVWLNGFLVGSAQLGVGWEASNLTQPFVDTQNWQSVEAWNVSGLLKHGTNVLLVKAVNEYMGPLDNQLDGTVNYNPAGLIFELNISGNTCPSGCTTQSMTVVSNSDVQVIKGNTGLPTPYAAVAAFEPGIADPNPPDPNGSAWDIQLSHVFTGGADWIWESNRAVHSLEGDIAYFQRTFSIGDYPTAGTLFITCDNGYEVWLNGFLVGSAQLGVGWEASNLTQPFVDTQNWQSVEAWNVSGLLKHGTNVLLVKAVNEYMGPLDNQLDGTVNYNPAGLIFELNIIGSTCPLTG